MSLHQTGDCESRSTVKCAKKPFQSVAFRFWLDPISRSRCRMYVILYAGRQKVPPNITNGATYDLKKAYKPKRDLRYSHANKNNCYLIAFGLYPEIFALSTIYCLYLFFVKLLKFLKSRLIFLKNTLLFNAFCLFRLVNKISV